jgi:hypothetical protein
MVSLLPLDLCERLGIEPHEVMSLVCGATDQDSSCSICDDDERSDSSASDAPTCIMSTHPNKRRGLALQDVPPQLRPTGGIKNPQRFKTTFCNKFPRCPFGRRCQHAHSQEEIDFWNNMRMIGSPFVRF